MNILIKLLKVIKNEGLNGVIIRLRNKKYSKLQKKEKEKHNKLIEEEKEKYNKLEKEFYSRIQKLKYNNLNNFYWYHTIDIGNGIITPGDYDYRDCISSFNFPENMKGMKVLDVGSATGYFAFEFEKRGADVTSVELPSLLKWDMVNGEEEKNINDLKVYHKAKNYEETYNFHLKGPFDFCKKMLNSKIKRCYSTIYDLPNSTIKNEKFDIVFLGDILLHLFSPFKALNEISKLCKGTLIIATDLMLEDNKLPLMYFLGFISLGTDHRTWWAFNKRCIEDMVKRLGFTSVDIVGKYSGIARRGWFEYNRYIFHAKK